MKKQVSYLVAALVMMSPMTVLADDVKTDRIVTTAVTEKVQKRELPELKVKDVIENWDDIVKKNSKDKIVTILGDMPLYDGSEQKGLEVYRVKTTDGDFLVYDPDLDVDFFSLRTNNEKYKVYNVLLANGELLSSDQSLSYGERGAFASEKPLDRAKVVKIFVGTDDPKDGTLVFSSSIDLGEQGKVYTVADWAYEMDKFALSGYVARRSRTKDEIKISDLRKPVTDRRDKKSYVEERDFKDERKDDFYRRGSDRDDRRRGSSRDDRRSDDRSRDRRRTDGRYDKNDRYGRDDADQKRIKELESKIDELMKQLNKAGNKASETGGTVIVGSNEVTSSSVSDTIKQSGVQLDPSKITELDKKYSDLIDDAYYRYKDNDKLRFELENIMIQLLSELNMAKAKNIYISTVPNK